MVLLTLRSYTIYTKASCLWATVQAHVMQQKGTLRYTLFSQVTARLPETRIASLHKGPAMNEKLRVWY